jgi:transposase
VSGEECVVKPRQTEEQISRLGNAIERALSLRSDIESRISPVLINQAPLVGSEKTKDVRPLVPLAQTLYEFNAKINNLNDGMESILNRIEL